MRHATTPFTVLLLLGACTRPESSATDTARRTSRMSADTETLNRTQTTFSLTSSAFKDGDPIPTKYTCDGANVSPSLTWSDAPPRTASYALIVDDPDAPGGNFVHWVLYDVPAGTTSLPEGVPTG